jgi:hypothetical protein
MIGPCWIRDASGCQYWVGPHVITPETEDLGSGRWRDEFGEHYCPPARGVPLCAPGCYAGGCTATGEVLISDDQRTVHVTAEAVAVFVAAPFSIWLAFQKKLPPWARALSGAIGIGTLIIDGGLLYKYLSERRAA